MPALISSEFSGGTCQRDTPCDLKSLKRDLGAIRLGGRAKRALFACERDDVSTLPILKSLEQLRLFGVDSEQRSNGSPQSRMTANMTGAPIRRNSRDDFQSMPGSTSGHPNSYYSRNASYASTAPSSSSETGSIYMDLSSAHSVDRVRGGSNAPYSSLDEAFSTNHSGVSSVLSRNDSFADSGFSFSSEHGGETGRVNGARTGRVIRVKDTGVSFRFPLEDDYLPTVHPTPAQYAVLKKRALALAEQSVKSSHLWLENPTASPQLKKEKWKVHLEKKNCVIYRQRGTDTKATQIRNAIVRAKLYTTLDEVAYALYCDNTEEQRSCLAHCYQDSFLDAAVLDVAETATAEDPFQFLGIKWFAFQSSMGSGHVVLDMPMIEFSKTFRDAKGQKVLARVCQSVNLKDLEGSEHSFGFVRSQIQWVNLFRWTGSGSSTVDAVLSTSTQYPATSTPSWLADRIVSSMYTSVMNLTTAGDAKFIVKKNLITNKAWVPNSERSACSVCFKSFSLLRSRHHCRICAEIMCSTCTMELTIRSSELPPSLRPQDTGMSSITSAEKFCLTCINQHRADRRNLLKAVQTRRAARSAASEEYEARSNSGHQSDGYAEHHRSVSDADSIPYQHRSSEASYASSSSDGSSAEQQTTINSYLWSSRVNTAAAGSRSVDIDERARIANLDGLTQKTERLRVRTNPQLNSFERRRQGSNASNASSSSTTSKGSYTESAHKVSEPRRERWETANKAGGMILLEEEPEDVESIRAMPTTFLRMEEAIAAQQALLRNLMIEGNKIMRSNNQQKPSPGHRGHQGDFLALQ